MSARYDSDGERIDAPSRAEAQADAIALGDLEPTVTAEQVAAWREGYERALRETSCKAAANMRGLCARLSADLPEIACPCCPREAS